jgi:hypothetical protein
VPHSTIFKLFRKHSLENVYDFERHVELGESLDDDGRLPVTFMLLPPQSWSEEVWADVTRMMTLNANQRMGRQMQAKGKQDAPRSARCSSISIELCDRAITSNGHYSNEGDLVLGSIRRHRHRRDIVPGSSL